MYEARWWLRGRRRRLPLGAAVREVPEARGIMRRDTLNCKVQTWSGVGRSEDEDRRE